MPASWETEFADMIRPIKCLTPYFAGVIVLATLGAQLGVKITVSVHVSRNPSVDFAPMRDESVLFQPETNQFCLLNATATFLWTQLDQPRSVTELADRLCQCFDAVNMNDALRDVEKLVEELHSLQCLVSS